MQRFPPKSPPYAGGEAEFRPFAVGYVALPGGIAVEGRLTGADAPDGYRIGMPMRLVLEPFLRRDGTTVAGYAFAPHPGAATRQRDVPRPAMMARRPGRTTGARHREHSIMSTGSLAIVGIGIHPFGRNEDVSGLQMGVAAARAALADAGISWADIQFAVGGSDSAGQARHDGQPARPDRPPVHQRDQRLRHRRGGPGHRPRGHRRAASTRSGWSSGSTSTRAAPSTRGRRTGASAPGTAIWA